MLIRYNNIMINHINLLKCRYPTFVPGLKIMHFLDVFIRLTDKTPVNSIDRTPSLIEKNVMWAGIYNG